MPLTHWYDRYTTRRYGKYCQSKYQMDISVRDAMQNIWRREERKIEEEGHQIAEAQRQMPHTSRQLSQSNEVGSDIFLTSI